MHEPAPETVYALPQYEVTPVRDDVSRWDPAIEAWRDEWLAMMRSVGLDSLRRLGKPPLHPGYVFLAYTRTYHGAAHSERMDLEPECSNERR